VRVFDARRIREPGPGRLFCLEGSPVATLAPARLQPAGPRRRRMYCKHVTGIQFSATGEVLASYNDDDIFLFSREGYLSAGCEVRSGNRGRAGAGPSGVGPVRVRGSSGGRGGGSSVERRGGGVEDEGGREEVSEVIGPERPGGSQPGGGPKADSSSGGGGEGASTSSSGDDEGDEVDQGREARRRSGVEEAAAVGTRAGTGAGTRAAARGPRRRRRSSSGAEEPPHAVRRIQERSDPTSSSGGGGGGDSGSRAPRAAHGRRQRPRAESSAGEEDRDEQQPQQTATNRQPAANQPEQQPPPQRQQRQQQRQQEASDSEHQQEAEVDGDDQQDFVIGVYTGHRNAKTVKGVSFLGPDDDYVVSGSDCGHIYIWSKSTGALLWWGKGDDAVVNCLEPHPFLPMTMATSGIDDTIKVWAPTAPERRPVPAEAHRVMERNRESRSRGPDRAVLPLSPQLLRLLFNRRGLAEETSDEEGFVGEGEETEDGEGCRVS